MTKTQLAEALKRKEDSLDIISAVTCIRESRLKEIIKEEDMTQNEYILLHMHC